MGSISNPSRHNGNRQKFLGLFLLLAGGFQIGTWQPASAQSINATVFPVAPPVMSGGEPRLLAATSSPDVETPIDLTPVNLPERPGAAFQSYKSESLYRLPSRMFFDANVENSLRLETNVFQTLKRNRADGVYRILPNVTLGYALDRKTRVSANYFYLRDNYMLNAHALNRSIHSVGFAINRDLYTGRKGTITGGFFARELFITRAPELCDLLPSVSFNRRVGQRGLLYGSITGQIRMRKFLGRFQEFDQFYSFGGLMRRGAWTLLADNTFVSNFGRTKMRGGHNQQIFVLTMEASRPVHRRLPLVAFVRAQPIFNIGASGNPGFAGFDFRLFSGLRLELSKPAIFPVKIGRDS